MNIISTIVDALTEFLTASTTAIGQGFENLFIATVDGEKTLSTLGIVMLTFVGLGFAVGLVYVIINLFR